MISVPGTLLFIGVITLWRFVTLRVMNIDLYFDEAQYWHWAQELACGYFSKPPMVAWAIAATTSVCGDGEACIKAGSALAHAGTATVLFFVGRRLYDGRVGFWSALVFLTLPGVSFSSLLVSPVPFLMLFWALGLYAFIRTREKEHSGWWLACGTAIGLGMLSKYAMVAFILSMVIFALWSPQAKGMWRRKGPWLALLASLVVWSPNILWNVRNGFISFIHTGANANLKGDLFHPLKALEFLGGQFAVFGPILFALFLLLLVRVRREGHLFAIREDAEGGRIFYDRGRLLFSFAFPLVVIMTLEGLLSRAHANWAAPAYVAGSVAVTGWAARTGRMIWIRGSVLLHVVLAVLFYNHQALLNAADIELPAKTDPVERIRGWDEIGEMLSGLQKAYPETRLLFDERKVLAPMLYYVRPHPFDALKWNPSGVIHDHYDLTTDLSEHPGEDFLYVTRRTSAAHLAVRFEEVKGPTILRLKLHTDAERRVHVFHLNDFKGYAPKKSGDTP